MVSEKNRLVGEARQQPVKNAFRIGLEFLDQNRLLAAMTMGAFIVLTLLEAVPVLGLAAAIAIGVFSQSVQIYVGRTFYEADGMEGFADAARQSTFGPFMGRYRGPAFGAWLGWFIVGMALGVLFFIVLFAFGADPQVFENAAQGEGDPVALITALATAGIPVLFLALLLTYFYPAVQGRVILSDSFNEAFRSVFTLFSPSLWKQTMNGEYFRFIFYFGLALMGILVLIAVTMSLLFMIPFLGVILAMVWMMFLLYAFILIISVANMIAFDMVHSSPREGEAD